MPLYQQLTSYDFSFALPGGQAIRGSSLVSSLEEFSGFDCCKVLTLTATEGKRLLRNALTDMVNAVFGALGGTDAKAVVACARSLDTGASCASQYKDTALIIGRLYSADFTSLVDAVQAAVQQVVAHTVRSILKKIVDAIVNFIDDLYGMLIESVCGRCGAPGGASSSAKSPASTPATPKPLSTAPAAKAPAALRRVILPEPRSRWWVYALCGGVGLTLVQSIRRRT